MMKVRLGFVAMSEQLKNCSPSQTVTVSQFQKMGDYDAALERLERVAKSNIENCIRLLRHCAYEDIHLFRLSSKLIPLADHSLVAEWDYLTPLSLCLRELGQIAQKNDIRVDFHPDHFVVLNSPDGKIVSTSVTTLKMHYRLLKRMGINPTHRCVLHVGGGYKDKELALEQLLENWGNIPVPIQSMVMFENDDTTFTMRDTLYVSEKLGVPMIFDYHHYLANHEKDESWVQEWERVVKTWSLSHLPVKMHISSPRNEKEFRAHHDYIDCDMFLKFLDGINGSVEKIDCMIEAKKKDGALFQLVKELKECKNVEFIDKVNFIYKPSVL